jgi:hypothetical protein
VSTSDRVRVYLPLTPALLRAARDAKEFTGPPLLGHAVTPALVAELGADEEEGEYAALTTAVLESLEMLTPEDPPRRVVAAVDVASWEPRTESDHVSAVLVPTTVGWRRLASVHVDAADAATAVSDARDALAAATADPAIDAAEAVERCLDHEPGWFAVQEIDALLEDLWLEPPGARATIG